MPNFGNVPVIETARLRLRGHRQEDFENCASLWSDPMVTRYIGGKPFSPEEVWARLLRYVGHWRWLGFGYWVIEELATGAFAGELGFADYKRDMEPSLNGAPELGWVLSPRVHGQGYATEAVRAVQAWGDDNLSPARTVCLIQPDNAASLRVANKCGFKEFRRTSYKGHPTIVFERRYRSSRPEGSSCQVS
jgi:RimJ/RimL family protein N-acetyltransferase